MLYTMTKGKEERERKGKGKEKRSQIYTKENKLLTVIAINKMSTKTKKKFDNKHKNHSKIHTI